MGESIEHTATPWKAKRSNWRNEPDAYSIYISGDTHISVDEDDGEETVVSTAVAVVLGNATSGKVTKANADFIVRAVNAHDDLLAACEAALQNMKDFCDTSQLDMAVRETLEAAINKAKGPTT